MNIYIRDLLQGGAFVPLDPSKDIVPNRFIFKLNEVNKEYLIYVDDELLEVEESAEEIIFFPCQKEVQRYLSIKLTGNEDLEEIIEEVNIKYSYTDLGLSEGYLKSLKYYKGSIIDFFRNDDCMFYGNSEDKIFEVMEVQKDYKDSKELLKILQEGIRIVNVILEAPQVALKEVDELISSQQAKRITKSAVSHLIANSQYWYKERFMEVKPLKVMAEAYEEILDTYENRMVVCFIETSLKLCRKEILKIKKEKAIADSKKEYFNNMASRAEQEDYIMYTREADEAGLYVEILDTALDKYTTFLNSLYYLLKGFSNVRKVQGKKFKMTQKIFYDKRYLKIYKLLGELESLDSNDTDKDYVQIHENYYYDYILMTIFILDCILRGMKLERKEVFSGFGGSDNSLFESSSEVFGDYNAKDQTFKIRLSAFSIEHKERSKAGSIILSFYYKTDNKLVEKTFRILPMFINIRSFDDKVNKYVEDMYKLLKKNSLPYNFSGNYICFPSSYENMKSGIAKEGAIEKLIFKITSLGNNFASKEDYQEYGNFRFGMLPINEEDIYLLKNKIENFIKTQIILMGKRDVCPHCFSKSKPKGSSEFYCERCKSSWYIHKCKGCGHSIVKFIMKKKAGSEPPKTIDNIAEHHRIYEAGSKFMGACYELKNLYDNNGGFCSNCGTCLKAESMSQCKRCSYLKEEKQ